MVDAAKKQETGLPIECAASAERDAYALNGMLLRMAGAKVAALASAAFHLALHGPLLLLAQSTLLYSTLFYSTLRYTTLLYSTPA